MFLELPKAIDDLLSMQKFFRNWEELHILEILDKGLLSGLGSMILSNVFRILLIRSASLYYQSIIWRIVVHSFLIYSI